MQLTGNLVFIKTSPSAETEVSRVAPLQGQTRYAYSVIVTSTTVALSSVSVELEYSNDMDNWETVPGSTASTTTFPANLRKDNAGATAETLSGEFVRLKYQFTGGSGGAATIQATISLKSS